MSKQKQILLIEPDTVLGTSLTSALNAAGYKVTLVSTAQDAVTSADKITPDLVILELQLVSHSGIEFLYEFRSYPDWEQVPAIIYSSVPPTEFVASREGMGEELGVVSYLYKPNTTLTDLVQVVYEQLRVAALSVDAAT